MPQFVEEFVCAVCAQTGHATWKGDDSPQVMIELSDGFEQDAQAGLADDSGITCRKCGALQPRQMEPL